MANFLQKPLIKKACFVLLLLFSLLLIITLIVNIYFFRHRVQIQKNINQAISRNFTVKKIFYFPPNRIILDEPKLSPTSSSVEKRFLEFKNISLKFSISSFIAKRKIVIHDFVLHKMQADFSGLLKLIKDNQELIQEILRKRQAANISFRDSVLILSQDPEAVSYFWFDMGLNADANNILGQGISQLQTVSSDKLANLNRSKASEYISYNFNFQFSGDYFNLENIEVEYNNLYLKLWGMLEKNYLKINGFSYISNFFTPSKPKNWTNVYWERLKKLFSRPKKSTRIIGGIGSNLNIFNIDFLAKIQYPLFEIDKLSFSVNNIPCLLKGKALLNDPFSLKLDFSSYPNQPQDMRLVNKKKINFNVDFQGSLKDLNGSLSLDFTRELASQKYLDTLKLIFNGLKFYPLKEGYPQLSIDLGTLIHIASGGLRSLDFSDFNCLFYLKQKNSKFCAFNSSIYDGDLRGNFVFNKAIYPPRSTFRVNLSQANLNEFKSVSKIISKMHGVLSANIKYSSYPSSKLEGGILIKNGYFDKLGFFNWAANTFSIPSLKMVNFNTLSANFFINRGIFLDEIDLKSKDVILKGDFGINENQLISSRLILELSRQSLKDFSKFRPLLRYLDKDLSFMNLEFQLSGSLESLNFKWLESDFKKRLQSSIPGFIERGIEAQVEKMIKSIKQ